MEWDFAKEISVETIKKAIRKGVLEVKFFPGKNIKSISFESASTFDLDVDIKISVDGNSAINQNGIPYNAPISFKVPKKQAQEAREIVKLVKKHYLCR